MFHRKSLEKFEKALQHKHFLVLMEKYFMVKSFCDQQVFDITILFFIFISCDCVGREIHKENDG